MDARKNILLIRLKSIGDILFTLPAVHTVRENFPDARLHFLVSKEHAPIVRGFADVDEIIPLDRTVFRSKNFAPSCANAFELLCHLREQHFSLAIDFQGYGETEFLSWWSGAPERFGSVYKSARGWTYTRGIPRDDRLQIADCNLSLLHQCGLHVHSICNEYILPAEVLVDAKRFFAGNHLDESKKALFIQPFTSSPHKNWPLKKFLELARHFQSQGIQILFGGGPAERDALEPVRAAGFPISAGAPLLLAGGLMKLSAVIVGGDTGLLHLAIAMGKRVVMLMPRAGHSQTQPFRHADWAVKPQPGKTIVDVQTGEVIEACARAFADCEAGTVHVNSPHCVKQA